MCSSSDRYLRGFPSHPPLTSLCDPPLLFVYFQVNTGVWYFLDYVEDIYDDDDGPPRILESCYSVAYHAFTRCTVAGRSGSSEVTM